MVGGKGVLSLGVSTSMFVGYLRSCITDSQTIGSCNILYGLLHLCFVLQVGCGLFRVAVIFGYCNEPPSLLDLSGYFYRVVIADSQDTLKVEKRVLQKGILLEFRKDSDRTLLAVAQKPDGKKNWMVSDQNGVTFSIKPQQVTYIVPGIEDFQPAEITNFLLKVQHLLDPSLLEYAWEELLEKGRTVNAEELAEIIYGKTDPLESYCAHLLLSQDEIYFSVGESKGYSSVYEPRPTSQVSKFSSPFVCNHCHWESELLPTCLDFEAFHAKDSIVGYKASWLPTPPIQVATCMLDAGSPEGLGSSDSAVNVKCNGESSPRMLPLYLVLYDVVARERKGIIKGSSGTPLTLVVDALLAYEITILELVF
eukprot:Gb_33852 [translate_table: standard]